MEEIRKILFAGAYNITLEIADAAASDRFFLAEIDGLGPPGVDVTIAGGVYQGRKSTEREIEVKIGLNPNYALGERPADLRREIYGLLTPPAHRDYVTVVLFGETENYTCNAYVKRAVPVPMAKDPQVQVTLVTEKAFFTTADVVFTPAQIAALSTAGWVVNNKGTYPTGFRFQFSIINNLASFILKDDENESRYMQIAYPFVPGDQLYINSDEDDRFIVLVRGNQSYELSGYLTAGSTWMVLGARENYFYGAGTTSFSIANVSYTPKYWGI